MSVTIVSRRPLSVRRSIASRAGVGALVPSFTEPTAGTPARALRSAAAPPVLNAVRKRSASLCDIFRSTTIVTGAVAVAPPDVLTVAVAENVSAPACARAGVVAGTSRASESKPVRVICRIGSPPRIVVSDPNSSSRADGPNIAARTGTAIPRRLRGPGRSSHESGLRHRGAHPACRGAPTAAQTSVHPGNRTGVHAGASGRARPPARGCGTQCAG